MQKGAFAYKPHKFAGHAVSSQTACINLFLPVLVSEEANRILPQVPGCPSDFGQIARDRLFHGFCFEYWGQDIEQDAGVLNDHSKQAGTDADLAIAYYDKKGELCLWLIEHKLSEKEFTTCGAYKNKSNKHRGNCSKCDITDIADKPEQCHYSLIGYKYWNILKKNLHKYQGGSKIKGCPFKDGLNQLWRNQMLAFALQETRIYNTVTFSICHHAKNTMLNRSINRYKALTNGDKMFSSFTNYDILNSINTKDPDLQKWINWYKEVYCF